jgi:hypothetical protein
VESLVVGPSSIPSVGNGSRRGRQGREQFVDRLGRRFDGFVDDPIGVRIARVGGNVEVDIDIERAVGEANGDVEIGDP